METSESRENRSAVFVIFLLGLVQGTTVALCGPKMVTEPAMRFDQGFVHGAVYCGAGPLIAVGRTAGVAIVDPVSGDTFRFLSAPLNYISCLAASPDGRTLATGGEDGTVRIWDIQTGQNTAIFIPTSGRVSSIAISRDGAYLAATGNFPPTVWNLRTLEEVGRCAPYNFSAIYVEFLGDSKHLIVRDADWNNGALYEIPSRIKIEEWSQPVMAVSGDAKMLAFFYIDDVILKDRAARYYSAEIPMPHGKVVNLLFSPDNTILLAAGEFGHVDVIDVRSAAIVRTIEHGGSAVSGMAFSPDGSRFATGAYVAEGEDSLRIWETSTGYVRLKSEGYPAYSFEFCPSWNRLLANSWAAVQEYDLSKLERCQFIWSRGYRAGIGLSPDGRFAAATSYGEISVWNAATGRMAWIAGKLETHPSFVAFSRDGRYLASGIDNSVFLFDTESGQKVRELSGHEGGIYAATFFPGAERLVTASGDATVRIWQTQTGNEIGRLTDVGGPVTDVELSEDGKTLMTVSRETRKAATDVARIWSTEEMTERREFDFGMTASFSLSADGTRLARTGSQLRVYDTSSGSLTTEMPYPGAWGGSLTACFAADGTSVITGAEDNMVRMWDVASGEFTRNYWGHLGYHALVESARDRPLFVSLDIGGHRLDGCPLLWDSRKTNRLREKILIVVGGHSGDSEAVRSRLRSLGDLAKHVANIRGLLTEHHVKYLSAVDTPDTNPMVDGVATRDSIREAILTWGGGARRLVVYLVGEGQWSPGDPNTEDDDVWSFRTSNGGADGEYLQAREMKDILDRAQGQSDPLWEAVLCVDAPFSGGFVRRVSGAPAGTSRVVIASTTADRTCSFAGDNGELSFSGLFFSQLARSRSFLEAFDESSARIIVLGLPPDSPQRPMLDDDGDGVMTSHDGLEACRHTLGALPTFGPPEPALSALPGNVALPRAESFQVHVDANVTPKVDKVSAVLVYTGESFIEEEPIANSSVFALERQDAGTGWQGEIPADVLERSGQYRMVYFCERQDPWIPGLTTTSPFASRFLWVGLEEGENCKLQILGHVGNALDRNGDGVIDVADVLAP